MAAVCGGNQGVAAPGSSPEKEQYSDYRFAEGKNINLLVFKLYNLQAAKNKLLFI